MHFPELEHFSGGAGPRLYSSSLVLTEQDLIPASGPAPRGAFRGLAPQMATCAPQTKIVPPPKRGLCPEEINRLRATGVQLEA